MFADEDDVRRRERPAREVSRETRGGHDRAEVASADVAVDESDREPAPTADVAGHVALGGAQDGADERNERELFLVVSRLLVASSHDPAHLVEDLLARCVPGKREDELFDLHVTTFRPCRATVRASRALVRRGHACPLAGRPRRAGRATG